MPVNPLRLLSLLLLAGLLSACDGGSSGNTGEGGIQLRNIGFAEWDQQLASYQPNIVVVDAWAMWCSPCIERFPKMVEMNQKYRDQGVAFVSLNLDDHNDQAAVAKAGDFLREQQARFDHFHMDENLIDAFDHLGLKGIPAVLIYDGTGEERFRLTGNNPNSQFTDEDIDEAVQQLLAER